MVEEVSIELSTLGQTVLKHLHFFPVPCLHSSLKLNAIIHILSEARFKRGCQKPQIMLGDCEKVKLGGFISSDQRSNFILTVLSDGKIRMLKLFLKGLKSIFAARSHKYDFSQFIEQDYILQLFSVFHDALRVRPTILKDSQT